MQQQRTVKPAIYTKGTISESMDRYFREVVSVQVKEMVEKKKTPTPTVPKASSWATIVKTGAEKTVEKEMKKQYDELCVIAKKNEAKAELEKIKRHNEYLQRKARREEIKRENKRRDELEERFLELKLGPDWYVYEEGFASLPGRCNELRELEMERDEKEERRLKDAEKRFDEEQQALKNKMSAEEWEIFNTQQHEDWMDEGSFHFGMVMHECNKAKTRRLEELECFLKLYKEFEGRM